MHSIINLNCTVNQLPMAELGEMDFDEEENDDLASIENKIESD